MVNRLMKLDVMDDMPSSFCHITEKERVGGQIVEECLV